MKETAVEAYIRSTQGGIEVSIRPWLLNLLTKMIDAQPMEPMVTRSNFPPNKKERRERQIIRGITRAEANRRRQERHGNQPIIQRSSNHSYQGERPHGVRKRQASTTTLLKHAYNVETWEIGSSLDFARRMSGLLGETGFPGDKGPDNMALQVAPNANGRHIIDLTGDDTDIPLPAVSLPDQQPRINYRQHNPKWPSEDHNAPYVHPDRCDHINRSPSPPMERPPTPPRIITRVNGVPVVSLPAQRSRESSDQHRLRLPDADSCVLPMHPSKCARIDGLSPPPIERSPNPPYTPTGAFGVPLSTGSEHPTFVTTSIFGVGGKLTSSLETQFPVKTELKDVPSSELTLFAPGYRSISGTQFPPLPLPNSEFGVGPNPIHRIPIHAQLVEYLYGKATTWPNGHDASFK